MQAAILLKVREHEKVTIGRNTVDIPSNKIQINSQFISSRHCQLIPEDGRLILTDSSRNGTWVTSTNSRSLLSPDSKVSSPSSHIKSINCIHNTTISLDPNTYIIFIPPTLCKVSSETVGLYFTGLDPTREFYHLECIKLNTMLANRQLMTFFSHMGFGKDHCYMISSTILASNDLAKQPRKRLHEEIIVKDSKMNSNGFSDDAIDCKTCKFEGKELVETSPKDSENTPPSKSVKIDLEQCQFCLLDFQVTELPEHCVSCKIETDKLKFGEMTDKSSHGKIIKEKSLEICIKCFKEFPIAELIQHNENCKVSLREKSSTIRIPLTRLNSSPF
ncbi:hypothetical protein LOD99_7334 [Oopsacas minuta]|uniref:FHA domain-containing protein n=1 Tax=Oopsacas minuta TaxID=111878 RepID=A0AAV7JTS2_9METZ|nr:hypothetical protein LOD99_7334 [Oopsacas minuta]